MRSATRCAGSRNCSAARAPVRPRRPLPSPCRRPAASGVCQGSVHASSLSRNSGNAPRESNWGASNRRRTESLRQAHTMQRLVQVHLSCTIGALSGAWHRDVEPATQNIRTGVLTGLRPLACVKPRRATSMPLWRMGASADEEEAPVKKAIKVAVEAILEAIARVGDFYEKTVVRSIAERIGAALTTAALVGIFLNPTRVAWAAFLLMVAAGLLHYSAKLRNGGR